MHKPYEYVGIELWGQQLSSFKYYIDAQQEKAADDNAPLDALYKREGVWVRVADLDPEHPFRADYAQALEGGRKG